MYTLLDFGNSLSWIESLGTNFGTVHDLVTPIKLVGIIHLCHSLLREVIPGIDNPPAKGQLGCQTQKLQPQAADSAASNCRSFDMLFCYSLSIATATAEKQGLYQLQNTQRKYLYACSKTAGPRYLSSFHQ